MAEFNDQFSNHAALYKKARPVYPASLFEWLTLQAPSQERAWDCATGNGQAALALAPHFDQIIATDASAGQLEQARPHEKVIYRCALSEQSGIDSGSIDLITVATAAHWFRLDAFYEEARRVMRPGAVIAMWTYFYTEISPEIDPLVRRLNNDILGEFWTAPMRQASEGYEQMLFPFDKLEIPQVFRCRADWNLQQLIDWFTSWSLSQQYMAKYQRHPVDEIRAALAKAWGDPEQVRSVCWPLSLVAGRRNFR